MSSIRIRMFDGVDRVLQQVRYIPELKRNLISLGILDATGYSFKSENGSLIVCKGSLVIMKGFRDNGLYTLLGKTVIGNSVMIHNDIDKTKLWHMRLGHVSERFN